MGKKILIHRLFRSIKIRSGRYEKDKLKKYSIRFGITFLIVIAFLTYFSGTIDNMLLPQVKVSDVAYGTINGEQSQDDRYLIPISAVIAMGDTGSVFVTRTDENNKTTVNEATVNLKTVTIYIMR